MAAFAIGTPVITREATVTVDTDLPVGRHRFRLEVIGAAGRRSAADEEIVEVQGRVVGPVVVPVIEREGPARSTGNDPAVRRPRSRRRKDER